MLYRRLSFLLPPDAEEELTAGLWSRGTLGLELADEADGRRRVDAWFPEPAPPAVTAAAWRPAEAELVASATVADEDWMAAYRRSARPVRLGARLVVDPRDEAGPRPAAEASGRLWLHLPAQRAFGTGSHASTRLAVELLDGLPLRGRTVLDLGTGTGVLAFAALAAGARRVVALDADPVAALIAGQNRARNRLWPAVGAGRIGCLEAGARFDVALVNILPERVRADLPEIAARLRPGAEAVFSGVLESGRRGYEERLAALGLATRRRRREGEWAALLARLET